jgi:alkyldihydroxyacetonephosphate synthase
MDADQAAAELARLNDVGSVTWPGPEEYEQEAWPALFKDGNRKRRASVVVCPSSADGVASVLVWAADHGVRVRARGGGSNVVGAGQAPAEVIVSTEALRGVVSFDDESQVITAGAGTRGGELEEGLALRGFTLGHYPQSLHVSTIGGWIAMRATGTYSAYFGGIERLLCGATVVLASGEIVRVPPRARASGGLDVLTLLCGSEGSLGIVTEASLTVHRRMSETRTCAAMETFAAGLSAARELVQRGMPLGLVRLSNPAESCAIANGAVSEGECLLIITSLGSHVVVNAAGGEIESVVLGSGGRVLSSSVADQWFSGRYAGRELMADRNREPGRMFDTFEVTLPWRNAASAADELERACRDASSPFYLHASHIYPSGTCLYGLLYLSEADDARVLDRWRSIWPEIFDVVAAHGGTLAHHHGIGELRARRYRETAEGRLHEQIAHALDGGGVLAASLIDGTREHGLASELSCQAARGA